MSVNRGEDGIPHRVGMLAVDTSAALHAFQALQAALFGRQSGVRGKWLQYDLMRTTAAFTARKVVEYQMEGGQRTGLNPPARRYRTKDGWLVFTSVKNEQFTWLMKVIGLPQLSKDLRYSTFEGRGEYAEELNRVMTDLMLSRSAVGVILRPRIHN